MTPAARNQGGLTLIELVIAVALGAVVLGALHSVVSLGLRAQAEGARSSELLYQGQFALERMVDTARTVAPKLLSAPAANSTGDWFAPARFCRNAANQLIETTTADATCAGTTVIASNVSAFSAQLPAGAGPVDRPLGVLSVTLTDGSTDAPVTLTTSVRLGGGTL